MVNNNKNAFAPTIVQLNNIALSHFLNRDYETAVILLQRSYEVFEACSFHYEQHLSYSHNMNDASSRASTIESPSSSSSVDAGTKMDASAPCTDGSSSAVSTCSPCSPYSRSRINSTPCENDDSSSAARPQAPQHQLPEEIMGQLTTQPNSSLSGVLDYEIMDSILVKQKAMQVSQLGRGEQTSSDGSCATSSSSLPSTAYSMYNRALVFAEEDSQDDTSLLVTYKYRTGAIILYNLALVHHTIGVQLGVSAALPHATRLYEMALQSIIIGCSSDSPAATPLSDSSLSYMQNLVSMDVEKLFMALLNNLGNIYTHLYDYQNAQRCFTHLRVVLAACSPGPPSQNGTSISPEDEEYTFFFLNAIFQGKELCVAPAA